MASAEAGGTIAVGGPALSGRELVGDRAPTNIADTAHYTLTTQRDWTARGAASGIQAEAPAIGVGTDAGATLVITKGYHILVKKLADPTDESALLNRIEDQPPLVSIAYSWTKSAANKIDKDKWQAQ